MYTRSLSEEDLPALEELLMREPTHNLFQLSALAESGLAPATDPGKRSWAVGVFQERSLAGVVMASRGTGGIYHTPGSAALPLLTEIVSDKTVQGRISLLSCHASLLDPMLPGLNDLVFGRPDRCYFRTLFPGDLRLPPRIAEFGPPRLATDADMERLIDFYSVGFYSLANLPSRTAWRERLSEQLAFRTLFIIEDAQGRVASAALSSAEGGHAAMLGGVATLSAYRGKGLSAACVGALCGHLFLAGIRSVSLFYLRDNYPAARVYDKLGFRMDGEWLLVPLGRWLASMPE